MNWQHHSTHNSINIVKWCSTMNWQHHFTHNLIIIAKWCSTMIWQNYIIHNLKHILCNCLTVNKMVLPNHCRAPNCYNYHKQRITNLIIIHDGFGR